MRTSKVHEPSVHKCVLYALFDVPENGIFEDTPGFHVKDRSCVLSQPTTMAYMYISLQGMANDFIFASTYFKLWKGARRAQQAKLKLDTGDRLPMLSVAPPAIITCKGFGIAQRFDNNVQLMVITTYGFMLAVV